jgi:hypothetical protein
MSDDARARDTPFTRPSTTLDARTNVHLAVHRPIKRDKNASDAKEKAHQHATHHHVKGFRETAVFASPSISVWSCWLTRNEFP